MKLTFSLRKSVEETAAAHFENAKKAKKKIEGVDRILAEAKKKQMQRTARPAAQKKRWQRQWFHNFRWFISSDGLVVVGGKDAGTNETLIKKHTSPNDVVFHTEMAGSPFVIVKNDSGDVPEQTLQEAAIFCGSFSRAWKRGLQSTEVYHVAPSQVTKEALPGEYIAKGSFMIYGKRQYYTVQMDLAVGVHPKYGVMVGPTTAVQKQCAPVIPVVESDAKTSAAKQIAAHLQVPVDEVQHVLPVGAQIRKEP